MDRCLVMGVVNVTPDSFSDGGKWLDADTAIRHGIALVAEGADLVDVGGESTRPGASRIDADEELRRVIPVIRGLVAEGIEVSVDTMRASTAREALEAGAAIVNDVSGGRADPEMMSLVAQTQSPVVLMHWREHSASMQNHTHYDDLVDDIIRELMVQVKAAVHAGVASMIRRAWEPDCRCRCARRRRAALPHRNATPRSRQAWSPLDDGRTARHATVRRSRGSPDHHRA